MGKKSFILLIDAVSQWIPCRTHVRYTGCRLDVDKYYFENMPFYSALTTINNLLQSFRKEITNEENKRIDDVGC